MATLEIPVNGNFASQIFTIPLDGVRYKFKVYYSFREMLWYADVLTDRDRDILLGIKLVPDTNLIGRFTIPNRPPGILTAVDRSGAGLPPGRDDLGVRRRVGLFYEEALA